MPATTTADIGLPPAMRTAIVGGVTRDAIATAVRGELDGQLRRMVERIVKGKDTYALAMQAQAMMRWLARQEATR